MSHPHSGMRHHGKLFEERPETAGPVVAFRAVTNSQEEHSGVDRIRSTHGICIWARGDEACIVVDLVLWRKVLSKTLVVRFKSI